MGSYRVVGMGNIRGIDKVICGNCDNTGWVCENHGDKPWEGESTRLDVCDCGGAGAPCEVCRQVQKHLAATGRLPINGTILCGQ